MPNQTISGLERWSKQDLAKSQLELALRLYLKGSEYPSVITLAGAAEEIFGRIAVTKNLKPALKRNLHELLDRHKRLFGEEAKENDFATLKNYAKNALKHGVEDVILDLEEEAAKLLVRALENYQLCSGTEHPKKIMFMAMKQENWRKKQRLIHKLFQTNA